MHLPVTSWSGVLGSLGYRVNWSAVVSGQTPSRKERSPGAAVGLRRRRVEASRQYPIHYERLDGRYLLDSSSSQDGTNLPGLFDLPGPVSGMITTLLDQSPELSQNVWRPAGGEVSTHPETWADSLGAEGIEPSQWRSYSVNNSLPVGTSSSHLKSIVPLEGEGSQGFLVWVRQFSQSRSLSGGGGGGGGFEGGGGSGGGVPGQETVTSHWTTSIVQVASAAEADAIDPLQFDPSVYASRVVVVAEHGFEYQDTTSLGQIRSYAVTVHYQVGLSFVWSGSQTTTETDPSSGGVTTETVAYDCFGTVTLSGSHTFLGIQSVEDSWLTESGFLFGSGALGVGLHSNNQLTASYSQGAWDETNGLGAHRLGHLQDNAHYTALSGYNYIGTSHTFDYSGARSLSLAREDTGSYTFQSAPQVELNYFSRRELSPVEAPEIFGIADINGPLTSGSPPPVDATQSLIATVNGSLSVQAPLEANGHWGLLSGLNETYAGVRTHDAMFAGFDYLDSTGAESTYSEKIGYQFTSPQRVDRLSFSIGLTGTGGEITAIDTDAMLELEDVPTANPDDDILVGEIVSLGQILQSELNVTVELNLDSRGASSTERDGTDSGAPTTLLAEADSFLIGFTPFGLQPSGDPQPELQVSAAPVASDERVSSYYWSAWNGNSQSHTQLSGPGSFNTHLGFGGAGEISYDVDGDSQYQSTASGTSQVSFDGLSLYGTAPVVSSNPNWTPGPANGGTAPYALAAQDQTGNGGFVYVHSQADNTHTGHGTFGGGYDFQSLLTPPAEGSTPPTESMSNHSATVATTADGTLTTTGSSHSNSSNTIDSDLTQSADKIIVALWDRTGDLSGDHRHETLLDVYEYGDNQTGSGASSDSSSETLAEGSRTQSGTGSGNYTANSTGSGLLHSFYELDEAFTFTQGSGSSDPLSGFLAGTEGMSRTLKLKSTRTAPLNSTAALNSNWNGDLSESIQDLTDGQPPGGNDPNAPSQYIVPIAGPEEEPEAQLSISGSGGQGGTLSQMFQMVGTDFSQEWDLHAWRSGTSDDSPVDVIRQGKIVANGNLPQTTLTLDDSATIDFGADSSGLKLTGNGSVTSGLTTSGHLTNPSPIREQEQFRFSSGAWKSVEEKIEPEGLDASLNSTTETTHSLDDFGTRWTLASEQNQEAVVGWNLVPTAQGTGSLTTAIHAFGTAPLSLEVTETTTDHSPPRTPSNGMPAYDSGTSWLTRSLGVTPTWDTTDTYVGTFQADGGSQLAHTIAGNYWEATSLDTEGGHAQDFYLPDSDPLYSPLVHRIQSGQYHSNSNLTLTSTRAGTSTRTYLPDGTLSEVSGNFTVTADNNGHAAAHDEETVYRIKERGVTFASLSELDSNLQDSASAAGLFAPGSSGESGTELLTAYRHYERDSNDHFDTHLTRTFAPSLQSDGTVNYDHETVDDVFSSRFWGSLEENDTRSVQSTTQLNGWDGQYWLFGPETVTKSDSYPSHSSGGSGGGGSGGGSGSGNPWVSRSSANGDALDWGFFDEANYHSFNYQGELIDTRFNSVLTTGASPTSWDDPTDNPLGGGPSFLQGGGGAGGEGQINQIEEYGALGLRVPPDVEARSDSLYSFVGYGTWGHYTSWYLTAAASITNPLLAVTTKAGGAFWCGLFRVSDDVNSETYAFSNGMARASGSALAVLLFPGSAPLIFQIAIGVWGGDQIATGLAEMATGSDQRTVGGQALAAAIGDTWGNLIYDLGPPSPAMISALRAAPRMITRLPWQMGKFIGKEARSAGDDIAQTAASHASRTAEQLEKVKDAVEDAVRNAPNSAVRSLDDVAGAIGHNADVATELARRAAARGRISSGAQAFGSRAHKYFERLNNRLNRSLIEEGSSFRVIAEEFRDALGNVVGRRAAGSIGPDAIIRSITDSSLVRLFDLKTHGGIEILISATRQNQFLRRFGAFAEEIFRMR